MKLGMYRLLLPLFLSASLVHPAMSATALALKKGEPFTQARQKILRAGWKPLETHTRMGGDGVMERTWSSAGDLFKAGFREVESCSGTGINPCNFFYKKQKQCLRLVTVGEYLVEYHAQPKVDNWFYECPTPEMR